MKAYSETKPSKVNIDKIGDWAHVSLFSNIKEVTTEDGVVIEYDYQSIKVLHREGLLDDINSNFELWVAKANLSGQRADLTAEDRMAAIEDVLSLLLEL